MSKPFTITLNGIVEADGRVDQDVDMKVVGYIPASRESIAGIARLFRLLADRMEKQLETEPERQPMRIQ